MRFKVTRQYLRGTETQFAQFIELNEAKFFVEAKLEADLALNVKVTYRIFELTELVVEFDPNNASAAQSSSGSEGKGSEASFRPTPLSTTARPAGMPQNWSVDKKDDEKK